ncbi:MAG: hypothetical protein JKY48_08610, partial [Flavobacteriales bacterium]|nr:hypothetical protein [Flavobacteriales bacterium]
STTYNAKATSDNKKSDFFPLMEDYSNSWYGRSCCFGAFRLPDSSYLFIVSIHNAANLAQAGHNLHIYDVHDVLEAPIDVSINGNLVDTGAMIFTGDFNVDYLGKPKEKIYYDEMANQSNYVVYMNRLTHLKGYQGSRKYANSYDLRSYCFDNFLIIPSVLNPVNEEVIDIPAWIKSDKNVYKTMINDTHLISPGEMNNLARDSIYTWIEKNIPAKKRQSKMIDVIIKAEIKFNRIDKDSVDALKKLCTNEQMFKKLMKEINGILAHCTRQFYRFAELSISGRNELEWYESLLLTRLISDHLPVTIKV